jgi:hypothetical protein
MRKRLAGNQDSMELSRFLEFVKDWGIKRYCEIGCRNGDTFYWVARSIGKDGTVVAVDLPENDDSRDSLTEVFRELQYDHEYKNAYVYLGNSHDAMTIQWVRSRSPFDLILIDADHRYSGVTKDFVFYHQMTKYMAFHDIAAPDGHMSDGHINGVGRFWREIKANCHTLNAKVVAEIVNPAGSQMGFGILEF